MLIRNFHIGFDVNIPKNQSKPMTILVKSICKSKEMLIAILVWTNCLFLSPVDAQERMSNNPPEATAKEFSLGFWDIPDLKEAFISPSPMDRKDGISVGKLGENGGDKAMVLELAQEIADGKHGNFDSFLILHGGELLFESYYLHGRVNLPHPQASATKVYTAFALGRAIQLGYLSMADLDKPLIHFLKDLDLTTLVKGAEKITLHHALTMRSGIRISEQQREEIDSDPSELKGQNHIQIYLERSAPITTASQTFKYQFDPILVMEVIEAVVPGTAKDFIKNELLDRLGITNYSWETDISGLPKSGSRSSMTSRDMAKWGILAMNKGKWNGEQLVPEAFVTKAVHRIVRQSDDENFIDQGSISNVGYGYFWWQADMNVGDSSYFSTSAQGGSGQTIILIEELDLIVITTVHRLEISVLDLVAKRILPAFIDY